MSRKNFNGNFDTLLGKNPTKKEKVPDKKPSAKKIVARENATVTAKKEALAAKKTTAPKKASARTGTKEGEKRETFIVKEVITAKIKAIAYQDRKKIKDVVEEALEAYLLLWEEENREIKL
jgi:hypothetical protein